MKKSDILKQWEEIRLCFKKNGVEIIGQLGREGK